jgi:hypothetical protein
MSFFPSLVTRNCDDIKRMERETLTEAALMMQQLDHHECAKN